MLIIIMMIIIIIIIIIVMIIIIKTIIITKKFVSFIRGGFRARPNIRDEAKYIYKFMSFFFQPHTVYLCLSLFK